MLTGDNAMKESVKKYIPERLRDMAWRRKMQKMETKMTPECREFLDAYTGHLKACIEKADTFLKDYEQGGMTDMLKGAKPFMDELSRLQQSEDPALDLYLPCHTMIYTICRKARPEKVVETGIQKGGSAYMVLKAMSKNEKGHLWSIDIHDYFVYNRKKTSSIGPLVEQDLKDRWTAVRGDAQKVLGKVLEKKSGDVDMFMAGQGHTYEVQLHEGETAWPRIRDGGIFILDRPDWNDDRYLGEFLKRYEKEIAFHATYKEGSAGDPFTFTVIVKAG